MNATHPDCDTSPHVAEPAEDARQDVPATPGTVGAGATHRAEPRRDTDVSADRSAAPVRGDELGDALARAVYGYWHCNGQQIGDALHRVAADHPNGQVREAARFDFVIETLTAYCLARLAEERAAVIA